MYQNKSSLNKLVIGVIGLGYVGLPVAVALSKFYKTVGFDVNLNRIKNLRNNIDTNGDIEKKYLKKSKVLYSNKTKELRECNIYIVTVPTPITKSKKPDLSLIKNATFLIGKMLKKNDIVIYESTFYPGTVRDICVPILEKISNLVLNSTFFVGYSPERINPGDKKRKIENIKKIVSGSNLKTLKIIDQMYKKIIKAGTHKAESIEIAEAAKVIENAQRDINIAFMNEINQIFRKLNLDTNKIIKAAKSKWNFLDFKPGLVGGHCIGVDPYYLSYIAKKNNINPKIITSGREVNDKMHIFYADKIKKSFKKNNNNFTSEKRKQIPRLLILGFTFKENCKDIRNTKIEKLVFKLNNSGFKNDIYDPYVNSKEFEYLFPKLNLIKNINYKKYDGVILAVSHSMFKQIRLTKFRKSTQFYDLKNFLKSKIIKINYI